ncbi:MAG TPA: sigma-54 dependent transcriptional regulator [Myxococcota bacterium]|nr:sigma-54 dependent transcriptional regulator [Myxococcota bacterium]
MAAQILVIDDDAEMAAVLCERLTRRGFGVAVETCSAHALDRIGGEDFDAVLTDVRMRGIGGIELCERIRASRPGLPVLVITAFGDLEIAVLAIRAGAYDFLTKPIEIEELAFRLDRACEHRRLTQEVVRLREREMPPAGDLLGESAEMVRLREIAARVAASDGPVLVLGETGSGKERVARAIHRQSARGAGPFVAVNCAAMPEHLIESELFGHERGAFTDARSARVGMLAQANRGTLLLDEIGELPLPLQPKLLRALQERSVRPIGASHEQPFDARVIAATNRDLDAAVEAGQFREDLFFRLDVLRVQVPPLRARGGDVLWLAQVFVRRCAERSGKAVTGLSRGAAEKLLHYPWPGNVRELENCIERAVALTDHDQVVPEDLPERIRDYGRRDVLVAGEDPTELVPLEQVEQRYIARVMDAVGGNKTLAAKILGVDRKTLYRKLGA